MKFIELKKSIAEEGAKPVYLVEGNDAYFRRSAEEAIKSAFLSMPELNFAAYEWDQIKNNLTEFTAACKNYPFMSEKRIVKVSDFSPSENDVERHIKPLFSDFPDTTILLIVNSDKKKSTAFKRQKIVTQVDCDKVDEETVAKWAYIKFKKAGIYASVEVCTDLARYCLLDMSRVSVEVEKLIEFKGEGTLTHDEMDSLVSKDAEYRIYELTNTVAYKDFTKFCVICDELVKKVDALFVLNGLLSYFKNLLACISYKGDIAALSELLGTKEYGIKKNKEQAKLIGKERLEQMSALVYKSISNVKSGVTSLDNALLTVKCHLFFD